MILLYVKDHRFEFIEDVNVPAFLTALQMQTNRVAVDTETYYVHNPRKVTRYLTKDNTPNNTPFLLTLAIPNKDKGWALEINSNTLLCIKDFLENPSIEKIFFNACYDLEMLLNEGIRVKGAIHDVMLLHHLLDEEDLDEDGDRIQDLKGLAVKYLDKEADKFEKAVDAIRERIAKERNVKKSEVTYYDVYIDSPDVMVDYASSDTLYTIQLFDKWYPELVKQELEQVYQIEMDCIWAVVAAEIRGYRVNEERLAELKAELEVTVEQYRQEIFTLYGKEFNVNSDEQLVQAFKSLGAEYNAITEKGNWQTNEDALKPFLKHCIEEVRKLAEAVLKYRDEEKMLNTFVAGIEQFIQEDGAVHPSFWQAGTRTGRMSSSKPNFQNFPKKDKRIRSLFMPREGHIIVFFDYAQQEYRLLAHYAREWELIDMIKKGYDVHKATASLMLNKPYEEITDEERDLGKRMNFAMVYGLGLAAIANAFGYPIDEDKYKKANEIFRRLKLKPWSLPELQILLNSVKEKEEKEALEYFFSDECNNAIEFAKQKKKEYFSQLPNVESFLSQVKKVCQRRGWVKTWTGRRKRYKDSYRDAYKAPNAIIQGGCGDILKQKAGQIQQLLFEGNYKSGIVNFVHDEIQVEIHLSELHLIHKIKAILDDLQFTVPITCDIEWTDTDWGHKKDLKELELVV